MNAEPLFLSWWTPVAEGLRIEGSVFRAAPSGLHVLFGPNNSGKSRILKLLCDSPATIEISWDTIAAYPGDTVQQACRLTKQYAVPPLVFEVKRNGLQLSLSAETRSRIEQFRHQLGSRIQDFFTELNGIVPALKERIEKPKPPVYIRAHRYLVTTAPIGNNDGNADDPEQMVVVLSRLHSHQELARRERLERIQKAFTEISGTTFTLRQSDKWTVHISEGAATGERPLHECGDGLRDLLGLILRIEEHPDHAVFIDEPGVRLHPRAQRALLRYLLNAAMSRPIWIATHDGAFIGSPDVASRYAVSRENGVTTARHVTSPRDVRVAFGELGWSPRDALLCDTILFCEGPSDRLVFSQILEEPGNPDFQGVEVVQLGGDRVWKRDTARLKSVVDAVKAVAPHARFAALLDRGGHQQSECDEVTRLLKANGIDVFWLLHGELEDFWIADREFCTRLCKLLADSVGLERRPEDIRELIVAESAGSAAKGSAVLARILEQLSVRFSKREVAELAASLITQGQGAVPKEALIKDLLRALRSG